MTNVIPFNADETLDALHWHEALDRTYIVATNFEDLVLLHPAVSQSRELRARAEAISEQLYDLYQRIGASAPEGGDA